jgi:hypothetical protein
VYCSVISINNADGGGFSEPANPIAKRGYCIETTFYSADQR